jgi:cytochrome c551
MKIKFYKFFQTLVLGSLFLGCGTKGENATNTIRDISDLKTKQYAVEGQQLYLNHCSNCHQEDGSGLRQLIPPLAGADYMLENMDNTIRIIKYGQKGNVVVNGQAYNQPMPANMKLTNLEIAQISTYIYNVWGHNKGLIDLEKVKSALEH